MISAAHLTILMIVSAGAAKPKDGGDDEWVHLPNKCEGNRFHAAGPFVCGATTHHVLDNCGGNPHAAERLCRK